MRVNWKVSSWNGVVFPQRREPTWSSTDDGAVKVWAEGILDRFGEYIKRMCEDSTLTKAQNRGAERAARFDDWGWVSLEVVRKRDHVETKVSVSNPNKCDGNVRIAFEDFAASLAQIIVAMWHNLENEKARRFIKFDATSPVFAEGVKRHEWVQAHPNDDEGYPGREDCDD